jgi:UDP-N-acetylenolpyruvoylglucosamine reductase
MVEVQRRVRERFAIDLTPEVEWWGAGETPLAFR